MSGCEKKFSEIPVSTIRAWCRKEYGNNWHTENKNERKNQARHSIMGSCEHGYGKHTEVRKNSEEIKSKQVFLGRRYQHVQCVGLDNGWYVEEVIGPAEDLVEYCKEKKEKYGIEYKTITIANKTWKHNEGYFKKSGYNIYTVGKKWNNEPVRWQISDNKEQLHKRFVNNCYGENWVEDISPSCWAVKSVIY
jgi:hypothetical protein